MKPFKINEALSIHIDFGILIGLAVAASIESSEKEFHLALPFTVITLTWDTNATKKISKDPKENTNKYEEKLKSV